MANSADFDGCRKLVNRNDKYITFLDTDDLWHKEKIKKQLNYVIKNNFKVCCTNFYVLNEKKRVRKKFIQENKKVVTTQNLLKRYDLGILTILIDKNLLKKNLFNTKYEIIGDFDFFTNLSLSHDIGFLNKTLATYRMHDRNLSLKIIDLHIKELESWIKSNSGMLKKKKISIKEQKFYLMKLKIKKGLNFYKYI